MIVHVRVWKDFIILSICWLNKQAVSIQKWNFSNFVIWTISSSKRRFPSLYTNEWWEAESIWTIARSRLRRLLRNRRIKFIRLGKYCTTLRVLNIVECTIECDIYNLEGVGGWRWGCGCGCGWVGVGEGGWGWVGVGEGGWVEGVRVGGWGWRSSLYPHPHPHLP